MRWRTTSAVTAVASTGIALATVQAAKHRRTAGLGYAIPDCPTVTDPAFERVLEALTSSPVTGGNTVTVLRNGCRIFPAMLDAIRSAERTIDFVTYVYWAGSIAEDFVVALEERARAGIEVNVLLDAVGAAKMDRGQAARLQDAGATVAWFRPPRWYTLHKLDNRTHRKVLVVDGEVGFTGGVGIAEEWTGDCEDTDHWRDTHLRLEGPVVRGLYSGFADNWAEATRVVRAGAHLPELKPSADGVRAHVTRSSASPGGTEAELLLHLAATAARSRLWVTSAYFAPPAALLDALVDAAQRGVDVQVLVNGAEGDKDVVRKAGRRSYTRLLDGGVRVHEYRRTMLHAKTITVDRAWCTVGSINMDNRSNSINDELNVSVFDETVVGELDGQFTEDVAHSEEIDAHRWARRPPLTRLEEMAAGAVRAKL